MSSNNDICTKLIERSGLSVEIIAAGEHDPEFADIVGALNDIHQGKQVLYGDYVKTHGSESPSFTLLQHFCDLKRKYVRAEHFIKLQLNNDAPPIEELLDTYADMAVYSVMGIQAINRILKAENYLKAK